ncbi:dihydrodipicolinate synthase family protein [Bradyrhizobium erythrophlei]|uniref:dihydrodipicolinate synthase family protein n=1 Tax=Bradyrhizobium erythrophlei TaxID=1437360 RepID=UPI0035ED97AF
MSIPPIKGVLSPVVTPFDSNLRPDIDRFVRHCRWLEANGVGLAVFGTNSEANSLSVEERMMLLGALIDSGIDSARMMPGTGCCSLTDSVQLSRHAVKLGCGGVLMLPPFYYKQVSDEGLYRYFSEVVERVGDTRLRIYLYHIPPVSQIPISTALIERLLKKYPQTVAGIKDSSGDWNNTKAVLEAFASAGFGVFAGSETFLLANMRAGGAGCISATANVNPGPIHRLYATWERDDSDAQQANLNAVRAAFHNFPMIPGLKQTIAHWSKDRTWSKVRPPLVELTDAQKAKLLGDLDALGFDMPGLVR